jgi:hypothetical protein
LASAVLLGTEVNAIDLNGRAPSEVNVRTTSRE